MSDRFKDKTVLITGASGGIGQALADRFASEGARLVLVDHPRSPLRDFARRFGDRVLALDADVTNEADADAAMAKAMAWAPRIDVAVLNAGVEGKIAYMEDQNASDFDHVMAVNVRGVFLWMARLLKIMKAQGGGAITATSSIAGLRGAQRLSPYVASKHAVIGLVKCAALEGASAGVRVNAVSPGPIETRMIAAINEGIGDAAAVRARTIANIPLQRYGEPSEVAALVAFLSSAEAGFISGVCYSIDGGTSASN